MPESRDPDGTVRRVYDASEPRVTTYDGRRILQRFARTIHYGPRTGQYASRHDENLVTLGRWRRRSRDDQEYALRDNPGLIEVYPSIGHTIPILFHAEQGVSLQTNYRDGRVYLPGSLTHGLLPGGAMGYYEEGVTGLDQRGRNVYFYDEATAAENGFAISPMHGVLMDINDPSFDRYRGNGNTGYHSGSRVSHEEISDGCEYTLGIEIEKEDRDCLPIPHHVLFEQTNWCKESDGSLGAGGYELVSPTYDLMKDTYLSDILGNELLSACVAGMSSNRCGGHLHVGRRGYRDEPLFDLVSGYLPLLYALYPNRIAGRFCEAKGKRAMVCGDKYQAIRLMGNRIEFRIFPAVENADDLRWRVDLLRLLFAHPNMSDDDLIYTLLVSDDHALTRHIASHIGQEQMETLVASVKNWQKVLGDGDYRASRFGELVHEDDYEDDHDNDDYSDRDDDEY